MRIPEVAVIDFETEAIAPRPHYPPVPVGVSIDLPGRKPTYYAWGHPTGNNTTKENATRILRRVWKEYDLCCQNAKFDYDVGVTHLGMPEKPWDEIHDTMYLIFFYDPHAQTISLKPSAERILGIKPKERDALRNWILAHIPGARRSDWGAYIARAPGQLVGRYSAKGDAYMTRRMFRHLYPYAAKNGMLPAYERERQLMPILLENEREGMRVDLPRLEKHLPSYEEALKKSEAWICRRLGAREPINFDKPADLAHAMERAPKGLIDKKNWPLTKSKKQRSTRKDVLDEIVLDKQLRLAMKYRGKLDTYLSMFLRQWADTARETGGIVHTSWNQVRQAKGSGDHRQGTRTGRPSSSPNFLNIPKNMAESDPEYRHPAFMRVPELPQPRHYCLPDKGHVWCHRDYDQQELRILAHFENGKLRDAYHADPSLDVHNFVRDEIRRITGMSLIRRDVKIINFGIIYGMGVGKLARSLKRDVAGAGELLNGHKAALPGIKDLNKEIKARARAGEPIHTWGGREYYVEEPRLVYDDDTQENKVQTFEYKLLNYLIQGSAADCTKQAIIDYYSAARTSRLIVTVYDEINITAPLGSHSREMRYLKEAMEAQKFDVPMLSDGKVGRTWGSVRDYKE